MYKALRIMLVIRRFTESDAPEVQKLYPGYAKAWESFENELNNPKVFTLVKSFTLPMPNLIPLSNVYIYKLVY